MKKSGIYQIKNIINNKVYIGSACDLNLRKRKHFSDLNLNKHHSIILQRAFNKYGGENFVFEILLFCPKEKLRILEQNLLDLNLGHYNSSKSASGFEIGRRVTKDENNKKVKSMYKKIIQYDLNMNFIKEWNSSKEAALQLNIYNSQISQCCTGKIKSAKGFIFKFKDNFIPYFYKSKSKYTNLERFNIISEKSSFKYKIILPTGKYIIIKNLKKYCLDNNLNISTMYNSYHKKRKTKNGYMVEKIV